MEIINDNITDNLKKTRTGKTSDHQRQYILKYYHKNKEAMDKQRYELFLQQKDTPEYKAMRMIHSKRYYEKQKALKLASSINVSINEPDKIV